MHDNAKPKVINSIGDLLVIGDQIRHKRLIDSDYREAVIDGYNYIDGELTRTTVLLPVWLRREVSMIHLDTNIAQGKIFTAMVNHGTALLQERLKLHIEGLHDTLRELTVSDNSIVIDMLQNFHISVNGVEGGLRRTIAIPVWCKGYLASAGGHLRMEFSSMIRLSLYLSISEYDGILDSDKAVCDADIARFEKKVHEYAHVCKYLTLGEREAKGDD